MRGPLRHSAIAIAAWCAAIAAAQDLGAEPDAGVTHDDQVEAFLSEHGLREVQAAQLRARLAAAPGPQRIALAERLGRIYVDLMGRTRRPEELARLESLGQQLLAAVPDAETHALRLDLAKARYLTAEEVVENSTLRLATAEQLRDAERALRSALTTFDQVAVASHRRVESLERLEERGRLDGDAAGQAALAEGRRLRSLSRYYAGWTRYYLAVLSGSPALAQEALVDFGWLLNAAPGQAATIDRLPKALLRYEHIARAAIGCSLASSLRRSHVDAVRWLDEVDSSTDLPDSVREQILSRRIWVLGQSRRWADLAWQVERAQRQRSAGSEGGRLSTREARLLAVITLEALAEAGAPAQRAQAAEGLAQTALAHLVQSGEVAHVLDLVQRYGTAPMGMEGFIVAYVRGLQSYDAARTAHREQGEDASAPATAPALVNAYRESANLLRAALQAQDRDRFERERTQCGIMLGFSLFYAGDFEAAADTLEKVASSASDRAQREEALWVAIVSMDEGVERGRASLTERRDTLAMLFLEQHPGSPRAAELLVRRAGAGLIDDEQAVQILLSVERGSPLYPAARRHASGLLYRLYRRAPGPERDFAAVRFADVAEEIIRIDHAAALGGGRREAADAAGFVVLRGRQALDALLGATAPDVVRAEALLAIIESLPAEAVLTPEVREELLYRRVQIALARGDEAVLRRRLDELRAMNGSLAQTADRLMYTRAARAWATAPADPELARQVVAAGQRVIAQYPAAPEGLADPTVALLHSSVAEAATVVWRLTSDRAYLDVAVRLDTALIDSGRATAPGMRRLAELSEAIGDHARAMECWRGLLSGLRPGQTDWFEARFESIRLMAASDAAAARRVMDQHRVLYPDYGPDPWGERLRDLDQRLAAAASGANP